MRISQRTLAIIPANPPQTMRRVMSVADGVLLLVLLLLMMLGANAVYEAAAMT